jgi:hypothetical protein
MHNAHALFRRNLNLARDLSAFHELLSNIVTVPKTFDDLLRSQLVYAVSAFDKLVHDLVRIGMVEIFIGRRARTLKYEAEPISMQVYEEIIDATMPPKEHYFEQALVKKFKFVSFQDPAKVADGLSYIWNEPQKWQKISQTLGMPDASVRTQLKLIVDRRNAIVHEADIDPITGTKNPITKTESDGSLVFLEKCGDAIYAAVK